MSTNDDHSTPTTSLEKLSRRSFLTRAGATGVVTAAAGLAAPLAAAATEAPAQSSSPETAVPGTVPITLKVNGETHRLNIDPRATVLEGLKVQFPKVGQRLAVQILHVDLIAAIVE